MGYCTTSPRRASSAASAGSPGRTTADDPRHRRTLPPAQLSTHARRLLHHHPALPLDEAGWLGHCTSSLGIPGSIASAGTLLHRHRRPPTAPHPLPPAQRSAHARRLPPHHPELLLSEAGWVGHCTSRPGTPGSAASAGSPGHSVAADSPASSPPAACAAQRACAQTAPPPPCTPPQLVWVGGALHKQARHSWEARRLLPAACCPPLRPRAGPAR